MERFVMDRDTFCENARMIGADDKLIELALCPPKGHPDHEKDTACAKRLFPTLPPATAIAAAKALKANTIDFMIYGNLPTHRKHGSGRTPEERAWSIDSLNLKRILREKYNYSEKGAIPETSREEIKLAAQYRAELTAFAENWVYDPKKVYKKLEDVGMETDEDLENDLEDESEETTV